jgi:hypothetical protein
MPGIRRRFGTSRGIGKRAAAPRGSLRGGVSLRHLKVGRTGSVKLPKLGLHAPQMGLPRAHIGGITIHPRLHFVEFDRNIIRTNWNAINRNPLHKAASYIRKVARNSIKRRKSNKISPAGTPPYSHWPGTTPPFKMIYNFPYGIGGTGQVIGMVGFGAQPAGELPPPGLHEHGGRGKRLVFNRSRRGLPQPRNNAGQFTYFPVPKFVRITAKYPQRPFMRPALAKSLPFITQFWQGSLSGRKAFVGRGSRIIRGSRR